MYYYTLTSVGWVWCIIRRMDWHSQNIKVYDKSAQKLAIYFGGIGSRVSDIERGLELANKTDGARVIEIGCGDGRDATEIVKRVAWYEGFDPSVGLLNIAKQKVPNTSLVLADALSYEYPTNIDIVYAFASLLHINQNDLGAVFTKVSQSLRVGGIFYISLKERDSYVEEIKDDEHGKRMFYYYNPSIIKHLAGDNYISVLEGHQTIGKSSWFTIALKKQ